MRYCPKRHFHSSPPKKASAQALSMIRPGFMSWYTLWVCCWRVTSAGDPGAGGGGRMSTQMPLQVQGGGEGVWTG